MSANSPRPLEVAFQLDDLVYDERGLLPVVVQEVSGGAVLMVAWANRDAIERTAATAKAHFWSRSRQQGWQKGETSGNVLDVVEILADCDADTLLYRAHPRGPTCHRGIRSCFEGQRAQLELGWLSAVIANRRSEGSGAQSYTRLLLDQGLDRVAQKVGEEAVEVVIAALSKARSESGAGPLGQGGQGIEGGSEAPSPVVSESADLLYHLLVLLEALDIDVHAVAEELARRHRSAAGATATPERTVAGDSAGTGAKSNANGRPG